MVNLPLQAVMGSRASCRSAAKPESQGQRAAVRPNVHLPQRSRSRLILAAMPREAAEGINSSISLSGALSPVCAFNRESAIVI